MNIIQSVIDLKEQHKETWRDKSQLYWAFGLLEEVAELVGALLRIHRGPVDWELMQISAICMNWLEMRNGSPSNNACSGLALTCAQCGAVWDKEKHADGASSPKTPTANASR